MDIARQWNCQINTIGSTIRWTHITPIAHCPPYHLVHRAHGQKNFKLRNTSEADCKHQQQKPQDHHKTGEQTHQRWVEYISIPGLRSFTRDILLGGVRFRLQLRTICNNLHHPSPGTYHYFTMVLWVSKTPWACSSPQAGGYSRGH